MSAQYLQGEKFHLCIVVLQIAPNLNALEKEQCVISLNYVGWPNCLFASCGIDWSCSYVGLEP